MEHPIRSHYTTTETLHALREARKDHPHLADFLAFHEEILSVQALAEEEGESAAGPLPLADDRVRAFAEGTPWLRFEDLALAPDHSAALVRQMADVLRRHRSDWAGETLESDSRALLTLARSALEGRKPLLQGDEGLTAAAVELSVQAAMRPLAAQIVPRLDLEQWRRETCPFCGSAPALALLEPSIGARFLFCGRCHTCWPFRRVTCAFCSDDTSLTYHTTDTKGYRLYVCQTCKNYLKTIDLREIPRQINPAVENLLTVGLDLVAEERGYSRKA